MASGTTEPDTVTEDTGEEEFDEKFELFVKSCYDKCDGDDETIGHLEAMRNTMKDYVTKKGYSVKQAISAKLDEWKTYPLHVAVIGRSGVGKSTFINTIRGVKTESKYAAKTGTTETTKVVTKYHHPENHQLVFCDLPGVGTMSFSKDTYLTSEDIAFDTYDMYLILTNQRVYEDDIWLAKQIKERGKKFLVIRTKIDSDIFSERKTRRKFFRENKDAETQVIEGIREDLVNQLKAADVYQEDSIYLIDGTDLTWTEYDFPRLVKTLIECYPELKRDAFILCMTAASADMIRAKANVLRKRAWLVSSFSGLMGMIPVPGVSFTIDAALIAKEARFYKEQFGLTEERLNEVAIRSNIQLETLQKTVNLKSVGIVCTLVGIVESCSALAASEGVEQTVHFLPFIGQLAAGGISFFSTKMILNNIIGMFENDALNLDDYINSLDL